MCRTLSTSHIRVFCISVEIISFITYSYQDYYDSDSIDYYYVTCVLCKVHECRSIEAN